MNKIVWPWMESDRSISMRRCLALLFALLAPVLLWLAFRYVASGWIVFVPGLACILAALLLLFFTTWADITELVKTALGKSSNSAGLPGS